MKKAMFALVSMLCISEAGAVGQDFLLSAPVGDCMEASTTHLSNQRLLPGAEPTSTGQSLECPDPNPQSDTGAAGGSPDCIDNWGLDRIDQRTVSRDETYLFDNNGTEVHVYIMDTGILSTHNEFKDANGVSRVRGGVDATTDPVNDSASADLSDCTPHGHGTHVAAIIGGRTYGVAKNVILHPVRMNCSQDFVAAVIRALNWIAAKAVKPAVVNWSGANRQDVANNNDIKNALALVLARGIPVVQSAGNQSPAYPATVADACAWSFGGSTPGVIVVGGSDENDERWAISASDTRCLMGANCGSNVGSCVDIWAPAAHIISASKHGNDRYCRLSGTSMAAPHVTGVIALYLETHPDASIPEIESALRNGGTWGALQTGANDPNRIGEGSPNVLLYSDISPRAPVAVDDSSFTRDRTVSIAVLRNDSDANGDPLSLVGVTPPAHGSAAISGSSIFYTPTSGYTGTDTFRYTISDGTGRTATALVGVSVAPPRAMAASLDGVDDYVQVGPATALRMTNAMTIEAWIHPQAPLHSGSIVNKEGEYEVAISPDGTIRWAFASAVPGWQSVHTGYAAPLHAWTHIAVTYDGGVVKTYANGNLVHTYNGSGAIGDAVPGMNDFRIGGRQYNPAEVFHGLLDEVRIWRIARTGSAIQADLHRKLANSETGLAGYWRFDEGAAGTASDATANRSHGSLNAGAGWAEAGRSFRHYALDLDGTNDYVQVGPATALQMTNAMTIEAWIQRQAPAHSGSIVNKEGEYEVAISADGTLRWAFANNNPGWQSFSTGYVAPLHAWTHIAVTYDHGVVKTYANGELVHTYNGSGAIGDVVPGMNDFRIGGRQYNAPEVFSGLLDEVRLWSVARAQAAIQADLARNLAGSEAGLAGYWRFDEGAGDLAFDATANEHHGTLMHAPSWVNEEPGARYALDLDGVDDYVQVGPAPALQMTNAMTIEAWIHPQAPIHAGSIVNKEGEYEVAISVDGTIRWAFANAAPGWGSISTGYIAPLDAWTHIAVTYDNGVVKTYANGELKHTHNGSGAIGDAVPGMNDFRIGGRQYNAPEVFPGLVDEVRIWSVARTQSAIRADRNRKLLGTDPGIAGYWRFEEGLGGLAFDATVNGNPGVLTHGPVWLEVAQ